MEMEYFEVITDAKTGERTIRPFTAEEIAAITAPPTKEIQEAARRSAYTVEADPIFFKAQRSEATIEEWQAKVSEIKARYPYPVV
jgi:hypothetical protein